MPNVSEGRDADSVAAMVEAAGRHATVLDVDSGWDAHRTVITLTGGDLVAANLALAKEAIARIDLRTHHGVHIRTGALDVVPFVGMDGEECRSMAEDLSHGIAALGVPVWRYGIGARDLRTVRRERGAFDFGPPNPHPTAGATSVGVRGVLVAFNVCLASEDLGLARRIARELRGLPDVLALGWHTPRLGCAQVSMNLTDWRQTPPHVVFEAIRARTPVLGCELVGMIPRGALGAAAAFYGTDLEGAVAALGLRCVKEFGMGKVLP